MNDLIQFAGTHIPQITGTLIMAAIAAYLTEFNSRRNRLAVAAEKFRTTFYTELNELYPIPVNWPKNIMAIDHILREKFPNLQAAVGAFRHTIPWYNWYLRKRFDRAWSIYRTGKDGREIDKQDYGQYIPSSGASMINDVLIQHDNTQTFQENFKRNVDNLLKFAKHT